MKAFMPMRSSDWTEPELAILRTVLYASVFEYPLTAPELCQTLLESNLNEREIVCQYRSSSNLQSRIDHREGLFFPRGRSSWIAERRRREIRSVRLLERNAWLLRVICALPFVRLVALSGSVAALNANRRADLDLFVITKGSHAWMVTVAVILLARLVRRRNLVCLNFVMSERQMELEQQDLFAANQIIQLRPIVGALTYERFLAANPFVTKVYPNFRPRQDSPVIVELGVLPRLAKRAAEALLELPSMAVERVSRAVYGRHIRQKLQTCPSPDQVSLSAGTLKLHMRSHRSSVMERFERLCAEAVESPRQSLSA